MKKRLTFVLFTTAVVSLAATESWPDRVRQAANLDRTGHFQQAAELYQSIVEAARALPAGDPRISEALNNAGTHYHFTGEYRLAEPLYREALSAYETAHEDAPAKLSQFFNNLGVLYRAEGRWTEAEDFMQRALDLSPQSGTAWANLAQVYRVEGKLEEAKSCAAKAITLTPETKREAAYQTMASILRDAGHLDEALKIYEYVRANEVKAVGSFPTALAVTLTNEAEIYLVRGEYSTADALASEALSIWEGSGATSNPGVAATLNNLAQIRKVQGRVREAEPLYRRALSVWAQSVGTKHPDYARGLSNLADYFHLLGNDRAADELYARAIAILENSVGRKDPVTEDLVSRRTNILLALGRKTDADRLARSFR